MDAYDESASASLEAQSICIRCEALDVVSILKHLTVTQRFGETIAELGRPRDWDLASCCLCRLFFEMRKACKSHPQIRQAFGADHWRDEKLELYAFSTVRPLDHSTNHKGQSKDLLDTTVLGVICSGPGLENASTVYDAACIHIASNNDKLSANKVQARMLNREEVSWNTVRSWLKSCEELHGQQCESRSNTPLEDGWIIDCLSYKIVRAIPGCRYAALSYVWGDIASQISTEHCTLNLEAVPKTIKDAIAVVRSLDLQYIWIDRYCIHESSIEHKVQQIRQMHKIYEQAYVTIVAAAGHDIDFGLPGVGQQPRLEQPQTRVGSTILLSSLPIIDRDVPYSTWNTRGWTYQEGALSRRRLIFTERQAYFECQVSHACESVSDPNTFREPVATHMNHDNPDPGSKHKNRYSLVGPVGRFLDEEQSENDLRSHINAYSLRRLTYDCDALYALTGILQKYKEVDFRHFHFGMPYARHTTASVHLCGDAFLNEIQYLNWNTGAALTRRHEFPSWSWAGWHGGNLHASGPLLGATDASIQAELETGAIVGWQEFATSEVQASRYLHIKGFSTTVSLTVRKDGPFGGVCEWKDVSFDMWLRPWLLWSEEEDPTMFNRSWPTVMITNKGLGLEAIEIFLLVLQPRGDAYEILGIGEFTRHTQTLLDAVRCHPRRESFRIA